MTRKLWIFLAFLLVLMPVRALADTPDDYSSDHPEILQEGHLYAESAFLLDMDTHEILLSKNSRVRVYPASTTKIMTLILALESGIPLEQQVTIPKEADKVPEGSSVIGIKSGDTMSWEDLLYSFMLRSGNDGSNAIAVLSAGSIEAFVQRMNDKAAQINCEGTHFVNAHGYHDDNHYTTAQDLARMSLYAMQNEDFRRIVAAGSREIVVTRGGKTKTIEVENRNSLVVPTSNYYYPGATGIKTGHHNKAGRCVVASAERSGIRLLAVVMDCATEERQYADARKLFNYGFSQYSQYSMTELLTQLQPEIATLNLENAIESDPAGGTLLLSFGQVNGGDVTRMIQRNSEKAMSIAMQDIRDSMTIEWLRELRAPVTAGETMGTVRFTAADGTEVSADLIATRSVEARPEPTPTATPEPTPQLQTETIELTRETRRETPSNGPVVWLIVLIVGSGLAAVAATLIYVRAQKERRRREQARRRARRRHQAREGVEGWGQPRKRAARTSADRSAGRAGR